MKKAMGVILAVFCAAVLYGRLRGPEPSPSSSPEAASVWTGLGPNGGNIISIARHPKSPSELYVLTKQGQVFRSADGCGSWTRQSHLDIDASDIALDPKNPRTVYVLSSEAFYKSADRGTTFTKFPLGGHRYAFLGRIAVHPQNPNIVFVSGSYTTNSSANKSCLAVFKSTNGGKSWTQKTMDTTSDSGCARDIVIPAQAPSTVYFCGYYWAGTGCIARIYRSTNTGGTWKDITPAFMNAGSGFYGQAYAVAVDPSNAARLFVPYYGGVAFTADAGVSWQNQTNPQSLYNIQSLSLDKTNPNVLYGGAYKTIYQSKDGGHHWTPFSNVLCGTVSRIIASGNTLQVTSTAGVFKSTNAGRSFKASHAGIQAAEIADFQYPRSSASAASANTAYAAVTNYGIFRTENGFRSWAKLGNFAGSDSIAHLAVPNADPNRVYLSTYG